MDGVGVGDYVIVHAGFVIHRMDEADALESIQLLKETLVKMEKEDRDEG
jgi:hydrogenase expression/formation protein HypC